MFRRLLPLSVAIVLVIGCKNKQKDNEGKVDNDTGASFTLKLREDQAGDKLLVTQSETGSADIIFNGKGEKEKQDQKLEYTEHFIEMPAGATLPTKMTRTYKVAQKHDKKSGAMKSLPFEGKTVSIEKKGESYEFTIDGKAMSFEDSIELKREFSKDSKSKMSDMLPKNAVKVGDTWDIGADGLKALGGDMPFPIDMKKSKFSGKLARAYSKDGKQWGVIEFNFDFAIDSDLDGGKEKAKGFTKGTLKGSGTMDVVIDGSSQDGTMNMNMKMDIQGKQGPLEMKINADMSMVKTITTLK